MSGMAMHYIMARLEALGEVDPAGFAVAVVVAHHVSADGRACMAGRARMAALSGRNERTMTRGIAWCREKKLLAVVQERDRDKTFKGQQYTLVGFAEWLEKTSEMARQRPQDIMSRGVEKTADPHESVADSDAESEACAEGHAGGQTGGQAGGHYVPLTSIEPESKTNPLPSPLPGGDDGDRSEDPKKIEERFWRTFKVWPHFEIASKKRALARWTALSPEDRAKVEASVPVYLARLEAKKRFAVSMASYLDQPDLWITAAAAPTGPRMVAPWGPLWAELVMKALLAGPIEVGEPTITRESRAAAYAQVREMLGAEAAEARYRALGHEIGPDGELLFPDDFEARIWREHVAANGYPKVKRLYQAASEARSVALSESFVESGAGFEAVPVGLKVWGEWKALFAARGWPWVPHTGKQPVVYFPAGGPDGWSAFESRIRQSEGKGHHADGTGLAAE